MVRRATQDFEVSVSPVQSIKAFRILAEQAGWTMERHEGARMVDRFAIIMPMTQTTRTLGLRILDGPLRGLEVTSWAETRGSSGALNMISWVLPGGLEHPLTESLLQHWVSRLPRCPWRWSFGERSKSVSFSQFGRGHAKSSPSLVFQLERTIGPTHQNNRG